MQTPAAVLQYGVGREQSPSEEHVRGRIVPDPPEEAVPPEPLLMPPSADPASESSVVLAPADATPSPAELASELAHPKVCNPTTKKHPASDAGFAIRLAAI
jgi:hypothetical protein